MVRFRILIAGIALLPAAAAAQWPENDPWNQDYSGSTRIVRGRHGSGAVANQLNVASLLVSSAFSLALSGDGKNGETAGKGWGRAAIGVGFASILSAGISMTADGTEPLLAVASIVSGSLSMMAGGRILMGTWPTPESIRHESEQRLSVAPIVAPTTHSAGLSASLRF